MAPVQATMERRHPTTLDRGHPTAHKPARLQRDTASLLRELAFVYQATRTVREAITGARTAP